MQDASVRKQRRVASGPGGQVLAMMTGAWRRRAMLAGLLAAFLPSPALPEPVEREPREVERLLREGSSALVAVSIESNRMGTGVFDRHEITPVRRLTFHVPASTVFHDLTRENWSGGQMLAFRLWSRTLDPVRPDEAVDRARCPPGDVLCYGVPGGRLAARHGAGEYDLMVELINATGIRAWHERVMRSIAGHDTTEARTGPCELRFDPVLGMTIGRAPPGHHMRACGRFWVIRQSRDGIPRPTQVATFLKEEPDGRARFVVPCSDWGEDPALFSPARCRLLGAFGDWQLFLWVRNDRAAEWEETHARVVAWLERHLTPESRAALGGMR